jgi:hypothetical protein
MMMEMNNKVIATNKTNPILMKIARREKWVKPFAKKLTAEDASQVKELHLAKLFMLLVPATEDDEITLDSGNGNHCVPKEIRCDDISIFNSDVIVDADGNQYHFADFLEHKQAYTFEIWNVLPDAHLESFTEFQYFTNVTEIPPFAFYRFKKLKSISLPPSIKTIGNRAFYGCVSLEYVDSDKPLKDAIKFVL